MRWVKLYTSWHNHPKTLDLSLAAKGLWLDCLAWAGQQETEGWVPAGIVRRIAGEEEGRVLAGQLVDVGLWEAGEGGWTIHGWTDHQPDAATRRDQNRLRQVNFRARHAERNALHFESNAEVTPLEQTRVERVLKHPEGAPAGTPAREEASTRAGQTVRLVFDAYRQSTNRNGAYALDAKRRRVIQAALKDFPLEDVLDAVEGWRHVPHNRGENDRRTVYNDLCLLLRDADHIERFRDATRESRAPRRRYDDEYLSVEEWAAIERDRDAAPA